MRFREMRERAGLTQTEVARRFGIRPCNVSDWELGNALPLASRLCAIADMYGCTVDELLGREPRGEVRKEETA